MSTVAPVTSSTQAAGTPTAAQLAALNSATNATGQTTLGENDFLKLLTVQLQNQDPLQPMSDTDFISQMATFSSLNEQSTLNTNFSAFSQTQGTASAASLVGKTVSVAGANGSATGPVTGVDVSNGDPQITVDGNNYDLSDITSIMGAAAGNTAAAAANAAAASTSTN